MMLCILSSVRRPSLLPVDILLVEELLTGVDNLDDDVLGVPELGRI